MKSQGFVYACSHDAWLEETIRSALSVKKVMPDMERELYITESIFPANKSVLDGTFTKVVSLRETNFTHRPRFDSIFMTTLDQAIFIDGDTLIIEPCYELFQVLDDFDIALCLAPQLHHPRAIESNLHSFLPFVSMAVAEFNAGLIVAKKTEKLRTFVESWMRLFKTCLTEQYAMDQVSLRVALSKSDLRIATLPNNYNFRANINQSVAGVVKILHCHGELEEIAKIINQQISIRLYIPPAQLIHGMKPLKKKI
jgi:hypothetical protein